MVRLLWEKSHHDSHVARRLGGAVVEGVDSARRRMTEDLGKKGWGLDVA